MAESRRWQLVVFKQEIGDLTPQGIWRAGVGRAGSGPSAAFPAAVLTGVAFFPTCHLLGPHWRRHTFPRAQRSVYKQNVRGSQETKTLVLSLRVSVSQKANASWSTFRRLPLGLASLHQVKGKRRNGCLAFSVSILGSRSVSKEGRENGRNICVYI